MPLLYEIPDETRQLWERIRQAIRQPVESVDATLRWPVPEKYAGPGLLNLFDLIYPNNIQSFLTLRGLPGHSLLFGGKDEK